MRPQPQGYVRGRIWVPGRPSQYALYQPFYSLSPPGVRLDPVTGEFVAGPFPAGPALLQLSRPSSAAGAAPPAWQAHIGVVPGKVVRVTLSPEGMATAPASHTAAMLTMGAVLSSDRDAPLSGTVFLPNGKTPAWGARVALVVPPAWPPVKMARADAAGHLTEGDYRYSVGAPVNPPPGSPTEPVVVAWLPGASGAAVVPYVSGQAVHVVLPAPAFVQGRVTVGGKAAAGVNSSFRVVAAYQGRGKLNPLLSVEATAQADGSFELAGLTPGTYRVQAARDGVWVSSAQALTVGGGVLPDLTLDIPGPGQPMNLRLVNRAGRPLPGAIVTVSHPPGPLTDELWPKTLTADSMGGLHLEGLAAGPQTLTILAAPAANIVVTAPGHNKQSPLATVILDVPAFVAGSAPVQTMFTYPAALP